MLKIHTEEPSPRPLTVWGEERRWPDGQNSPERGFVGGSRGSHGSYDSGSSNMVHTAQKVSLVCAHEERLCDSQSTLSA